MVQRPRQVGHEDAGATAVQNDNGGLVDPSAKVEDAEGDEMGMILVEDVDFSIGRRAGHAVAVVVKEEPIVPRLPSHGGAQTPNVLDGWVERALVLELGPLLPPGVLRFELLPYPLSSLGAGHGRRVDPTLQLGAGVGLLHVGGIRPNVERQYHPDAYRLHPLLEPPGGYVYL